jgi:CSLREA domain-containing protein
MRFLGRSLIWLAGLGLVLVAAVGTPPPAHALILQVRTTTDEENFGNGVCSLREAIIAANTDSYARRAASVPARTVSG